MGKLAAFIQKLWTGKLSPGEAAVLDKMLRDDDGELREELAGSFVEGEIQQTAEEQAEATEIFAGLLAKIERRESKKAKVISVARASMGWAAILIVLAGVGALVYRYSGKQVHANVVTSTIRDTPLLKSVSNRTRQKITITLKDGSVVDLFSNSTIFYREDFDERVRNIKLEGKAYFKVGKDAQRPFNVLSAGYTTTALGTAFSVDTRKRGEVQVKLYEGKVVVRPANKDALIKKDVFLAPMQSFTANLSTGQFAVSAFNPDKLPPAIKKNKIEPAAVKGAELDFNNEPLKHVFDMLNERFGARIKYSEGQLEGLRFTGTVFKTDSLKTIVTIISKMNGLTPEERGGYILIQRKK